MENEDISQLDEQAIVAALLVGSDQPPEQTEEASLLPEPDTVTVKVEDTAEGENDVIEELLAEAPSPAPAKPKRERKVASGEKKERKERAVAFADQIAKERAENLLGADVVAEIVAGMSTAPKKVADKVYNVLCHIGDRGKLSNYTKMALRAFGDKNDVTSGELVELYKAAGYSEATARSQAHQQMTALPILGLAARDGDKLTIKLSPILPLMKIDEAQTQPEESEQASEVGSL